MRRFNIFFFAVFLLASCQENAAVKPQPIELTVEAAGYYCQMTVLEHDGPKAQIHLEDNKHPFWFTQVRDAVAFSISPEEPKNVAAIYVSDMGKAESWDNPGTENWIDAANAWYVIESKQVGGMGTPEAIPFGTIESAEKFSAEHGGKVVQLQEIPEKYVFSPVELSTH